LLWEICLLNTAALAMTKVQISTKKMGRCPISCDNNLRHAQKKLQAKVEDIMDPQDPDFEGNLPQNSLIDLLEEGFFMLGKDLDSDNEDETKDEECEDESMDKPNL
jgi:hypothetical protein